MRILRRAVPLLFAHLLLAFSAMALENAKPLSELAAKLKALPGVVSIVETRRDPEFREGYALTFEQPVDHQKPDGAKFQQRVFVSHTGYDKPVLLETEGYATGGNYVNEMQRILGGNMVTVEHRFFGKSVPSPRQWEFLTVKQSADDLHAVTTALKTIYPGKWVSSGTSKGGQTSLYYKCYYPDDVAATVAYVAPINVTQEDPRINQFLETVGSAETRKKITDFQIALFKREDELLPLIKAAAEKHRWTFVMSLPEAFEYGVLEYPYAFWQDGGIPAEIPAPDAPAEKLVEHYLKLGMLTYIADPGRTYYEPYYYQAFTETGYYNYDITNFKQYMKHVKEPSNLYLCPPGVKIVYNPATLAFVHHYLQYEANNIVYICGETDAWSATQVQLLGRTDAIKIVVANSPHAARIAGCTPEQKDLFYSTMERWLGIKLMRK